MADVPDPSVVDAIIREVAEAEITPRFRNLSDADIRQKTSAQDLVTEADVAAERALAPRLEALLPGSRAIGEESAAEDPAVLASFRGEGAFWLIDPVDGTWNFAHGRPEFGTMVALVVDGATRMGWIHMPLENRTAIAETGAGAFWGADRLGPHDGPAFDAARGDYPARIMPERWREAFDEMTAKALFLKDLRCSAYTYLDLARGRLAFYLCGMLTPWDHAAGALLVAEAGGRAAFYEDGGAYDPLPRAREPLLVASDARRWAEYRAALTPPAAASSTG